MIVHVLLQPLPVSYLRLGCVETWEINVKLVEGVFVQRAPTESQHAHIVTHNKVYLFNSDSQNNDVFVS